MLSLPLARGRRRDPPARAHRGRRAERHCASHGAVARPAGVHTLSSDADIYRFDVGASRAVGRGSTFLEQEPRLSPDGRRLAFGSARSGRRHDRYLGRRGRRIKPAAAHAWAGRSQGSPSWSPDGRRIAFDSFGDDWHFHIWMIDADGGTPRRLTTQAGDEHVPTWSHDGRWIYFSGDQGTGRDIWRVSASGGTPERLTRGAGGPFACESADGKHLLFQPKDADSPLMAMALAGGEARQLVACVRNSAFGAGPQGVYYVPCDSTLTPPWPRHAGASWSADSPLHAMDLADFPRAATGHSRGAHGSPPGSECVARRQDDRLSKESAVRCRPDVDRELPVM